MKKYIGFFVFLVFLVFLDALTKAMAVAYAPQGDLLRLVYNPNGMMGFDPGVPYWKVISIAFLPVFWFMAKDVQNEKYRYIALALMMAGAINNSFERLFSSYGVVDFLNLSGQVGLPSYYCNFADIYQWVGYVFLVYGFSLNKNFEKPETVQTSK